MSIKTGSQEQQLANATAMGEQFASERAIELLQTFLLKSGIAEQEFELHKDLAETPLQPERFLKVLAKDHILPFKQVIAAVYTLGALDAFESAPLNLYKPAEPKIERSGIIV